MPSTTSDASYWEWSMNLEIGTSSRFYRSLLENNCFLSLFRLFIGSKFLFIALHGIHPFQVCRCFKSKGKPAEGIKGGCFFGFHPDPRLSSPSQILLSSSPLDCKLFFYFNFNRWRGQFENLNGASLDFVKQHLGSFGGKVKNL